METKGKKIACWDWDDYPVIGIKVHGVEGKSHPISQQEEVVEIDTGFGGWLLLPYEVYKELKLHLKELPQTDTLVTITGEEIPAICALAEIEIPQLNLRLSQVRIHSYEGNETVFLIGRRLLKRKEFKTILNGPESKTCLEKQ